jgi:hypothetical protein
MKSIVFALAASFTAACLPAIEEGSYASEDPTDEIDDGAELQGTAWCPAQMSVFPVSGPHNTGYDVSCNDNNCDVSCGGERANSDYGGNPNDFHHGIDIFAHRGAPIVAVAAGHVLYARKSETTGSMEVKIRDACGWNYYYGHLDTFAVAGNTDVVAGQVIGTMGNTGTGGVHLHFNASPGDYSDDINPLDLLRSVQATACTGEAQPDPSNDPSCGRLNSGETLAPGESRTSCSGAYTLNMQADGNLVLYPTNNQGLGGAVWDAHVWGTNIATMQTDGNLVVYRAGTASAQWNAGTHGNPGAYLQIADGALYLRAAAGYVLWSSN